MRIALLEKGLPFEIIEEDLRNKSAEFLRVNPLGSVPALVDGGTIVNDSTIINEYLEEKYPARPLFPRTPEAKARCRMIEDYADSELAPSLRKIYYEKGRKEDPAQWDRERIALGEEEFAGHCRKLEADLKDGDYFCGDFSVADIAVVSHLVNTIKLGYEISAESPQLRGWLGRVMNRPTVQKALFL